MDGRLGGFTGGIAVALLLGGGLLAVTPAAAQEIVLPSAGEEEKSLTAQEKPPPPKEDLFKLDIERLLQTPVVSGPPLSPQQLVTTVARQESTVGRSPAAIFVITPDMIRRSGATSLPDVFRMVPGMDVARIDSSRWAISARGFNDRLSNKLLVQIDGRTIYNPNFSGVLWEHQDLLLEDVERIEVIRGPGATVWGQNAVNGIINIITKSAQDTQGGLLIGGGGSRDQGMTGVRHGGKIGEDLYYRVWGKWFEGGTFFGPAGSPHDDWRQGRGGFRFDWNASACDKVTWQGELFQGDFGRSNLTQILTPPFVTTLLGDDSTRGGYILGRWRHQLGERSDWALTAYYDNFHRVITTTSFPFEINTFDVDFQQQFPLTHRQQVIYGLGYRFIDFNNGGTAFDNQFTTNDPKRQVSYTSAFVQDELTVVKDRLFFTAGCKFLENGFSGFEYQPTGRLLWTPDERHSVWGAVSRAVRTPSMLEQDLRIASLPIFPPALKGAPLFPQLVGDRGVISEDVLAYEAGYRAQPTDKFSWDLALFYNVYDNLVTARPGPVVPGPVPGTFLLPLKQENGLSGESYGSELAANWKLTECWRLYGQYSFLVLQVHRAAGLAASAEIAEKRSPRNQVYLQSSWDLGCNMEFDLITRYVDVLPGFGVPSYFSLDLRWAWRPRPNLELAVIGQNLLDDNHLEVGVAPGGSQSFPITEVPRGVYATLTLRW